MTKDKQTTSQQQQATATPEETELNKLTLERARAAQAGQIAIQQSSLNLINNLLTGQALPGYLSNLTGGIDEGTTQSMVKSAIADVTPGIQSSGLLDSGTRAALTTKTAADVRNQNAQFNLQNLMQLLNIAVGGQAQVQSPLQAQSSQLASSLSGLRSISGSSTTTSANPFLKSFQESLGKSLGSGSYGSWSALKPASTGGVSY